MKDNFYASKFWKHLRAAALERDEHACTWCRQPGKLVVHHTVPRKSVLCRGCHSIHHWMIKNEGLTTIFGPKQEPYKYLLTDPTDFAKYLKKNGIVYQGSKN